MGRVNTRGILQKAIHYTPIAKAGPRTGVAAQSLGCGAVEGGGACLGLPCSAMEAKRTSLGSPCGAAQVEGTWVSPLPTSYCSAAGCQ